MATRQRKKRKSTFSAYTPRESNSRGVWVSFLKTSLPKLSSSRKIIQARLAGWRNPSDLSKLVMMDRRHIGLVCGREQGRNR